MLLTMFVTLYTVRIVLEVLKVEDYGLYNVVGGIVVMFSFLSNTMATASERFFAFEIGRKDFDQLKKTFSITILIYAIIAAVIFILAETVGLWFLNYKMVIPPGREYAANWVYQFSLFSFILTILTIPYNAAIIANENMKAYAYISIVEVSLKLIIVFLLSILSFDKLILYSILVFGVTAIVTLIYRTICVKKYYECSYEFYWDKKLFNTLISYSGWNLFGASASVLNNQGINIMLNLFFGPVVNAARAISYQIGSTLNQFVLNFMTATNPQITKYYASDEKDKMMDLVFQSCKLSFFLLFLISMPVLLETHFILSIWLKTVPDYVVNFTILLIISSLVDSLSYPLRTAAQSTGRIKKYQVIVGVFLMFNLPISYLLFVLGFPPQVTLYVYIVIAFICLFLRIYILENLINLPIKALFFNVLGRVLIASIVSFAIPILILYYLDESFLRLIIVTSSGIVCTLLSVFFIGLSLKERNFIFNSLLKVIKKKNIFKNTYVE